ncbi:MAG: hypothetical protein K2J67_10030 [Lachnospiraceae bacterium]|nr:hypothetical protein [Lachnospiraceae bacterium]
MLYRVNIRYLGRAVKQYLPIAAVVYTVAFLALLISCFMISGNSVVNYKIEIWIWACEYVDFFLPLVATLPFAIVLYLQKRHHFIRYASMRMKKNSYVRYHISAGLILSFSCTWLLYFISLVITVLFIPVVSQGYDNDLASYVFGTYQIRYPLLFGAVWCMWKGINAACFTLFGFMLALYVDNIFIINIVPFLYCMADNLVTALLQIPDYSIITAYVLNRLTPSCMHMWNYLVGTVSFLVITSCIVLFLRGKSVREYEY